jgi:hypothetical protein
MVVMEDTVVEVMETVVTTTTDTTTTKETVVVVATKVMVVVEVATKVMLAVVVAIRAMVVAAAITTEINKKTIVHITMDLHVRFAPSLVILQVNASKGSTNFLLHLKLKSIWQQPALMILTSTLTPGQQITSLEN